MGKRYEDLSRRALIKLDKDFDAANDAALLQYLTEHGDEYENIRPIEKITSRIDQIKDVTKDSTGNIKKTISSETEKMIDSIIDALSSTADIAESKLSAIKQEIKEV